ncbi:MAG TPA: hypothetical protein VE570_06370 [Thermoleophilaceae bacterium]|nr:hypothetical protein [Thermoleophilaceae bacterium]
MALDEAEHLGEERLVLQLEIADDVGSEPSRVHVDRPLRASPGPAGRSALAA